ncbi:MFS general substrate transporter [Macrolepiota fuliginosa MF-IS2]|uniref:MFS general substrate transporter n=1 Tax=Macrolepiota fuliginosa MF-IS2 TaxID=1400762 RepID=A0A9P5XDS7_9AGAR|nr:MFS general substrate transporter [Macrolepiota fuliginosa MF-IS2]
MPKTKSYTDGNNSSVDVGAASTSSSPRVLHPEVDEQLPLLHEEGGAVKRKVKKPFYRARPLWLVPFALVASLTRGMTLAPRVEVFTQLSCHRVYGIHQHRNAAAGVLVPTALLVNTSSSLEPSVFGAPVPTFIPISTLSLTHYAPDADPVIGRLSIVDGGGIFDNGQDDDSVFDPNDSTSDPRNLPSPLCREDPDVQAGAARLQMMMTTVMGLLSALTTVWWGHFGERYGRTRVLAISTFGLFLTDLVFILVSTPTSPLSKHGHKLLLLAPIVEGALGGWTTLQASTSAYISDCTSSGSRAHIFSRFTGATYLGIFFGPSLSGYLISRSGMSGGVGGTKNVTTVFCVAVVCSFVNFLAAVFVFPESLSKERREKARKEYIRASGAGSGKGKGKAPVRGRTGRAGVVEDVTERPNFVVRLFSPLAVFWPTKVRDPTRMNKYRRDWSLTLLGVAFFGFVLCVGLYQLKYLYAEHVYGWGAEQLSWYISFLGGMRAVALLLVLPYIIGIFKPKVVDNVSDGTKGKDNGSLSVPVSAVPPTPAPVPPAEDNANGKPKPTRKQLGREIAFDLTLTRCSFLMDVISNLLIMASPAPAFRHSSIEGLVTGRQKRGFETQGTSFARSQALFVLASGMSSFGTGAAPAIHSLTLCILQAREMVHRQDENGSDVSAETIQGQGSGSVGGLFAAFAFLQSIGSMILGPMMFGMVYSSTVGFLPKAIFMVATATLCVSLVLMMLVQNPVQEYESGGVPRKKGLGKKKRGEVERGRSRVSKDLRGGAAGFAAGEV